MAAPGLLPRLECSGVGATNVSTRLLRHLIQPDDRLTPSPPRRAVRPGVGGGVEPTRASAHFRDDQVVVQVDGQSHTFPSTDEALVHLGHLARQRGSDVYVDGGDFEDLVITPDGEWFNPSAPDVRDTIPGSPAAAEEPSTPAQADPPQPPPSATSPVAEPKHAAPEPPWVTGKPASEMGWTPSAAPAAHERPEDPDVTRIRATPTSTPPWSRGGQDTPQTAASPAPTQSSPPWSGSPAAAPAPRASGPAAPPWSTGGSQTEAPRSTGSRFDGMATEIRRRPGTGGKTRVALIAGGAVAVVLALVVGGYFVISATGDDPAPDKAASTSPTSSGTVYIPALAPKGYSTGAIWADTLADGTYPVVSLDGMVGSIAPDNTVKITNPHTGDTLLASPNSTLPRGLVTFTESPDGTQTSGIAWLVGTELHTWTKDDGEKTYQVDKDAGLYGSGSSPMVWAQGSNQVSGLVDGRLVTASIPADTTPMGITDGHVISSTGRLPVWVTPLAGGAPKPVALTSKKDKVAVRRWIGMAGSNLLIAWTTKDFKTAVVRLHDALTGKVLAQARVPWASVKKPGLVSSQDKRHPAVGPVFFAGNKVTVAKNTNIQALSNLSTRYGLLGDTTGVVGPDGSWTPHRSDTAIPIGTGPGGEAIVRVSGRVYSLPLAK